MKKFSTWMLVMFIVMFWAFRVMIAISAELNWEMGALKPLNTQVEIILLFVVLACLIFIVKRKLIGALVYLMAYGLYFGTDIVTNISVLINAVENGMNMNLYINLLMSLIGIILPIATLLDLLMDKARKANPKDKKTDWFYDNEQFDRKLDERADKNNYRTL